MDSNDTGHLDQKAVCRLLCGLLSHEKTVHSQDYFVTMLDLDRDGTITFNELTDAIKVPPAPARPAPPGFGSRALLKFVSVRARAHRSARRSYHIIDVFGANWLVEMLPVDFVFCKRTSPCRGLLV